MPGAPQVEFVAPAERHSSNGEGVVTLEWRPDPPQADLRFELQQAGDPEFSDARLRYSGRDRASVLTGFPEGTAHFRVRAIAENGAPGAWSEPVTVETAYMSRRTVWLMLGTGSVVFTATIATLLAGHFRHRRPV